MLDYRRFRDINDLFASGQPQKARRLLMEMQSRCIALRDEISMLRLRLQTAEDALFLSRNLYLEDSFYWLKSANGRLGPFCPGCYDSDWALIHLERHNNSLICPCCRETFRVCDAAPPSAAHARILQFMP